MQLDRRIGAGHAGPSAFRNALSIALAAIFASAVAIPTQFAYAGIGGAGLLDQPVSADSSLVTKVGQGRGGGGKGNRGGNRGNRGNNAVVIRGNPGNRTVVARGQKNTVVRRTYVNKTYVNKRVVVVRPVRGWYKRPYYGNFVSGVALGTILGVAAVGMAPVAPSSNLCWYWSDPAMINGYWDYCY